MHPLKLRLGRWQFAPSFWPTLAAAVLIGLTLSLGNWQTQRASYKRTLQARVDAGQQAPAVRLGSLSVARASVLYRRVEAQGIFDPRHEILLDNRIYNGVAGYHVLTPLKIIGSNRYVLVNRGWTAVGKDRSTLPRVPPLSSEVKIEGLALDTETRYFELPGARPVGRLWQNLNFERYVASSGLSFIKLGNVLQTVTHRHLRRDPPGGVVGENLFVVVGGHRCIVLEYVESVMFQIGTFTFGTLYNVTFALSSTNFGIKR